MNDFGQMKANSKDRNAEKLIKQDFRVGRGLGIAGSRLNSLLALERGTQKKALPPPPSSIASVSQRFDSLFSDESLGLILSSPNH